MTTSSLPRKLILTVVAAAAVLSALTAAAAVALHAHGEARLEAARLAFEARWGHLEAPSPRAPLSDPGNAARWLESGGRSLEVTLDDHLFYTELMARPGAAWTDAERAQARRILDEQRDALAELLMSGSTVAFRLASDGPAARGDETDHLEVISAIRLLVLETRLAWREGRRDDCLAALNALGRNADGLLRTPTLLAVSLGAATQIWTAGAAADVVGDPCADAATLVAVRDRLPSEDAIVSANRTLAASIAEIANEGLRYIEDVHDHSMGWTIPFWISNRYLLEDLVVAAALESWSRYLELGQIPVARWPADAAHAVWAGSDWPPWVAMAGAVTPNLLPTWARAQAASSRLTQVRFAVELRLASTGGVDAGACDRAGPPPIAVVTGAPVACRFDTGLDALVVEVTDGEVVLARHFEPGNLSALLPAIVIPAGGRDGCD
ncbi:MAG TPA: hypothetical protein VLB51_05435 [Methylomirabilota bacterium]|nr:hypothetical protein [Methylomirabilota bacterium]